MLQRILLFLPFLLLLPDFYIYRMFISRMAIHPTLKIAYWLPSALLLVGLIYMAFFASDTFFSRHMQGIGWYAIAFFLFAVPKLNMVFCSLLGLPFNYLLHWPKAPFVYAGFLLAAINTGIILYGSFVGKTRFEVKEVAFQSPRLPEAFDGYRIVQLSDIHIGSWKGNERALQRMIDIVNEQHPDLIVFTGDLVNNLTTELNGFEKILSGLQAKDGIYSILGNHDYGAYHRWNSPREQATNLSELKKRQADMGWKLLNNEHALLYHGGDSIALIGVENEGEPPFSQHGDLPKAIRGTEGMFQLLLSHNPTHWRREVLPQSEVDLMLAGHTHAMQMALGRYSPSSFVYPEWGGMYTAEKGRGLYVNVGLGFVGIPFRFGAWPEITVLTLERS